MEGTATLVSRNLPGYHGIAHLYRLDPPIEYQHWVDGEYKRCFAAYVVVSATFVPFSGAETYIFPADKEGEVTYWGELPGSFRGGIDHDFALNGLGYSTIEERI